jgi:hypothetical protein
MNKGTIGSNAGFIWKIMDNCSNQQRYWSYDQLREATNMADAELYAAIGWLARENKVEFTTDTVTGKENVFLNVCYYF